MVVERRSWRVEVAAMAGASITASYLYSPFTLRLKGLNVHIYIQNMYMCRLIELFYGVF